MFHCHNLKDALQATCPDRLSFLLKEKIFNTEYPQARVKHTIYNKIQLMRVANASTSDRNVSCVISILELLFHVGL